MLAYIASSLPHYVYRYYNILPLYQERLIPIWHKQQLKHVNIVTYFVLHNEMYLARYLLGQTLDNIPNLKIELMTADQIVELLSDFAYTVDQSTDVINILEQISHEKLNSLVSYLYSICKVPNIVGYTHISKYRPDIAHQEYYDIISFSNNYSEAEYILSLIHPDEREEYCQDVLIYGNIDFNTVDIRYLKLILDNCNNTTHRYYHLAYAIVYDKFIGKRDTTLINQFLYAIYNDSFDIGRCTDVNYIVHLERLITTKKRMKVLDKLIQLCSDFPKNLPPIIHQRVVRMCLEKARGIPLIMDDCKYCKRIIKL